MIDKWYKFAVAIVLLLPVSLRAQNYGAGGSVYAFLNLPTSSRLTALGGENVSIHDGELSMALQNPALLCGSTDRLFPAALQRALSERLHADFWEFSGFGHAVYDLAPDYRERMMGFFKQ